jgi:hypothetical protein
MESTQISVRNDDALLSLAIEKGMDTETLEKLIALRNAELERQARTRFAEEFARMQAEFRPVGKSKTANDYNGKLLYSYCPIEDILAMAAPIMAAHGFSYRWTEEALPNKEKRINCIVSGHGWSETSFVDIPFMDPVSKATNVVQMRGSATTYGKRYSFLNATGIIVGGEDNDALSLSNPGAVKTEVVNDGPFGDTGATGQSTPETDPADALRQQIRNEIARAVALLEDDHFTDEDRARFKAKIGIAKGATKDSLAYVKTVVDEYRKILEERTGFTPLAKGVIAGLQGEIF